MISLKIQVLKIVITVVLYVHTKVLGINFISNILSRYFKFKYTFFEYQKIKRNIFGYVNMLMVGIIPTSYILHTELIGTEYF